MAKVGWEAWGKPSRLFISSDQREKLIVLLEVKVAGLENALEAFEGGQRQRVKRKFLWI